MPSARRAAIPEPATCGIGVLDRDDDPGDTGRRECLDARGRAPVVVAGLERDVDGRAPRAVTGGGEGFDLGVGTTRRLRRTRPDDLPVAHHDTADPRVGHAALPREQADVEGDTHQRLVDGAAIPVAVAVDDPVVHPHSSGSTPRGATVPWPSP